MKANEAPGKIYCVATEGGYYLTTNKSAPPFADGIEYIRTDAFIEKACKWLGPVFKDLSGYYSGAELLDDFKNYMKGE